MRADWLEETRVSYDTVAASYADQVRDALAGKPYLLAGLGLFAELIRAAGGGLVADVGCGPGNVAAVLHKLDLDVFGVDLSPGMIEVARHEHPHLRFEVGSMTELGFAEGSLAGVVAFWSLIHVPDELAPGVLAGFHRVLRPGGRVLLGFHVGDDVTWKTEGYGGHPMQVSVHKRQPGLVSGWLRAAGFTIEAEMLLGPQDRLPGALIFAKT